MKYFATIVCVIEATDAEEADNHANTLVETISDVDSAWVESIEEDDDMPLEEDEDENQ